jgi:hypothetical protein
MSRFTQSASGIRLASTTARHSQMLTDRARAISDREGDTMVSTFDRLTIPPLRSLIVVDMV